ncbi:MAG TPA: hypothetical protein VGA67_00435 [Candidatus Dojkabacteria bacterium]|jgi:hypothetical protein
MNDDAPNLTDKNSIAYNHNLRTQLETLHNMLGSEVTDIAGNAMEFGFKFSNDAESVLKYMSKSASQLSIALINARNKGGELTAEEQKDYDNIKSLAAILGNLQDKLNRVIKLVKNANEINAQISEQGMSFADSVVKAQEQFREVRKDINDYGFLSKNPELASLFEEQKGAKLN